MSRIVDADKKRALCARLARIEGQLRGLQKLIDGDADCEKIAQQMAAARKENGRPSALTGGRQGVNKSLPLSAGLAIIAP